ncbi:MAG: glycosyltransferase family 2 protein [Muribaculaceae bacterium]|nr:glycosyltransferase family 2 protein [Muribaculaceae bacterium]
MATKISVVINTYNAAEHLPQVLESVKDFDEIVICDMESTDDTLEIARRFDCKIVTFPKGEHKICEPARDFAIHSATHDWVLVVDADELIPPTLRRYLYDRISDASFTNALAISRINKFMGMEVHDTPDYQLRFFLKNKAVWPPIIHARPVIDGDIESIPAKRELSIIHLDNPTVAQRLNKLNLYSDYEAPKRKHKKYGAGSLLFRPVWFFIKSYIIGGGFKQGRRGIVKAYMDSVYQIMLLSKLTEEGLKISSDTKKK